MSALFRTLYANPKGILARATGAQLGTMLQAMREVRAESHACRKRRDQRVVWKRAIRVLRELASHSLCDAILNANPDARARIVHAEPIAPPVGARPHAVFIAMAYPKGQAESKQPLHRLSFWQFNPPR